MLGHEDHLSVPSTLRVAFFRCVRVAPEVMRIFFGSETAGALCVAQLARKRVRPKGNREASPPGRYDKLEKRGPMNIRENERKFAEKNTVKNEESR
jgi:hypothetical protein